LNAFVSAKTKTDMVVENVIQTIAMENYKPGDKIPPESHFIKEFDVSRVTVREAFKRLSSMGVVTIKSGDGTFVNTIKPFEIKEELLPLLTNKDTIEEIFEIRICIELFIMELAVLRRTEEDLDKLSHIIENMEDRLQSGDIEGYGSYDDQFHNHLSNICGNSILKSIYESLTLVRKTYIRMSNKTDENMAMSNSEHHEIYNALKIHDVEAAKHTMKNHLLRTKRNVLGKGIERA